MDKNQVNQFNRSVSVDGRIDDCGEITRMDYTQRLPVEILIKIFVIINQEFATSDYDIAKLRRVCKRWCDVIDNNFDFFIQLNNQTLHGPTMNHVRVSKCSVNDFYKAPPRNQRLFRDPKYIKELFLNGKVSRKNFFWLISQLTRLDILAISPSFLQHSNTILLPTNSDDESTINRFWANIDYIEIAAIQMFKNKNLNVPRNLARILSADMPKLKCLKIVGQWSLDFYSSIISFLIRHPLVNKIDLVLEDRKRLLTEANKPEILDFGNIQLKNIQYTTHCDGKEGHHKIMAFIKGQRSLEELCFSSFTNNCVDVNELRSFFLANKSTLTSLSLRDIVLRKTLDARVFGSLIYLKTLKLGKGGYDNKSPENAVFPAIANLTSLPVSLEVLSIRNLSCLEQDCFELVASTKFQNLRSLHLYEVGNDIMTPKFVDALVMKKGMQTVLLGRLDLSRFEVKERWEEKFIASKNGYLPLINGDTTLHADLTCVDTM